MHFGKRKRTQNEMSIGDMIGIFVLFWLKWMAVFFSYGISKNYTKQFDWKNMKFIEKLWHWVKSISVVVFIGLAAGYDDGQRFTKIAILIMAVLSLPVAFGIFDGRGGPVDFGESDE
jgi:hypothetical protein